MLIEKRERETHARTHTHTHTHTHRDRDNTGERGENKKVEEEEEEEEEEGGRVGGGAGERKEERRGRDGVVDAISACAECTGTSFISTALQRRDQQQRRSSCKQWLHGSSTRRVGRV